MSKLNHHAAGRKVYSGVKRVKGADLPRYLRNGKIVIGKKHTPSVGCDRTFKTGKRQSGERKYTISKEGRKA